MDLRVYPKNKKFVIQDMSNGRKQHGRPYPSKSAANKALTILLEMLQQVKLLLEIGISLKKSSKILQSCKLLKQEILLLDLL